MRIQLPLLPSLLSPQCKVRKITVQCVALFSSRLSWLHWERERDCVCLCVCYHLSSIISSIVTVIALWPHSFLRCHAHIYLHVAKLLFIRWTYIHVFNLGLNSLNDGNTLLLTFSIWQLWYSCRVFDYAVKWMFAVFFALIQWMLLMELCLSFYIQQLPGKFPASLHFSPSFSQSQQARQLRLIKLTMCMFIIEWAT